MLAPDKGNVFDKVHACEEATKLTDRCKRTNVSIASAPRAKYGRWPEKLRDLPTPPAGFTLDPTPETCTIAAEWQNYCDAKVK
ncbi:MAG: hypothetical protein JNM66_28540 [Bryobacterales bacterium]|nr:hypothetical protein [Bryobacterales bacterium]